MSDAKKALVDMLKNDAHAFMLFRGEAEVINAAWTADRDRAEKAEARVKVLEAALEPFASRELKGNYMTVSVYASDIRAARAAKEQS